MKQLKKILEKVFFITLICSVVAGFYALSVGFKYQHCRSMLYAQKVLVNKDRRIYKALFSPRDNVKNALLGLIEAERSSIHIASFRLTDKDIADALDRAARRGVKIFMVSDRMCPEYPYSKVPLLAKNRSIRIKLFPTHKDLGRAELDRARTPLMHNKFMIFKRSLENKSILWTGSFNFTNSAATVNQENVIVLDEKSVIDSYESYFQQLFDRSEGYIASQSKQEDDSKLCEFLNFNAQK